MAKKSARTNKAGRNGTVQFAHDLRRSAKAYGQPARAERQGRPAGDTALQSAGRTHDRTARTDRLVANDQTESVYQEFPEICRCQRQFTACAHRSAICGQPQIQRCGRLSEGPLSRADETRSRPLLSALLRILATGHLLYVRL